MRGREKRAAAKLGLSLKDYWAQNATACFTRDRSSYGPSRPYNRNAIGNFVRQSLKWDIKITSHGFRSTLTDWAQANDHSRHLIEMQIGHLPPGEVWRAYARDQLVDQRRPMMEAWGEYCSRPAPEPMQVGNVESLAEQREKRRVA